MHPSTICTSCLFREDCILTVILNGMSSIECGTIYPRFFQLFPTTQKYNNGLLPLEILTIRWYLIIGIISANIEIARPPASLGLNAPVSIHMYKSRTCKASIKSRPILRKWLLSPATLIIKICDIVLYCSAHLL